MQEININTMAIIWSLELTHICSMVPLKTKQYGPGVNPEFHVVFGYHVSLISLCLKCSLSLSLIALTFSKSTGKVVYRMFLQFGFV